jgi:hypothetical protein
MISPPIRSDGSARDATSLKNPGGLSCRRTGQVRTEESWVARPFVRRQPCHPPPRDDGSLTCCFQRPHQPLQATRRATSSAVHQGDASTAAAAVPGVVLCVANRIVRIVVRTGKDSGGIPRREINLRIGVAAGEGKRCDHDGDAEPHRHFPTDSSRPMGRWSMGRTSCPSRARSPRWRSH